MILIFLIGLMLGSFVNALVWRLQQQLDKNGEPKKLSQKQRKALSVLHGRSMCPYCKHQLAAKDLVPLLSWLLLKGRCRYCHKPINKEYPLVELITAILFVVSYAFWPYELAGAEWVMFIGFLVTLVLLIAMSMYDYKTFILPSRLIYPSIFVQLITLFTYSLLTLTLDRLGWAFLSALVYFGLFYLIFMASYYAKKQGYASKDWLGFGDVRLAFLLGLVVGTPAAVFVALFLGSVIGLIIVSPAIISKKATFTTQIPFGPYLIAGAYVALLFSDRLISWYTGVVLGL